MFRSPPCPTGQSNQHGNLRAISKPNTTAALVILDGPGCPAWVPRSRPLSNGGGRRPCHSERSVESSSWGAGQRATLAPGGSVTRPLPQPAGRSPPRILRAGLWAPQNGKGFHTCHSEVRQRRGISAFGTAASRIDEPGLPVARRLQRPGAPSFRAGRWSPPLAPTVRRGVLTRVRVVPFPTPSEGRQRSTHVPCTGRGPGAQLSARVP